MEKTNSIETQKKNYKINIEFYVKLWFRTTFQKKNQLNQ